MRDRGDARLGDLLIARHEFEETICAELLTATDLKLVDLRGDGAIKMGVPTDALRASDHSLSQAWGLAIHEHDTSPDGLIFPSRLNDEVNIAVFDRALSKLSCRASGPLLDRASELAAVIDTLALAIVR